MKALSRALLRAATFSLTLGVSSVYGASLKVLFPESLPEPAREQLRRLTAEALPVVEAKTGLTLREDAWIVFSNVEDEHNGLTTVIPNNRIRVHLVPPDSGTSIGLSPNYLKETVGHELAHMLVMQQRAGVFAGLDWVVGTLSRPLGTWPRWMHEGFAVWSEEAFGGRPTSGALLIEKKRFAEVVERSHESPIGSSDLDGSPSTRNDAGLIPYLFGYELVNRCFTQTPGPPGTWIRESSKSLGLSFRKEFASIGISVDQVLADSIESWKQTPLGPEPNPDHVIANAARIEGPFSSADDVSWAELQGGTSARHNPWILRASHGDQVDWNFAFARPLEVYRRAGHWIVLVQAADPNQAGLPHREVWKVDDRGRRVCRWKFPRGLRSIGVGTTQLAWSLARSDFSVEINEATFTSGCELENPHRENEIKESFSRVSSLVFDSSDRLIITRSRGPLLEKESIWIPSEKTEISDEHFALSFAHPLGLHRYAALAMGQEAWQPVVIENGRITQVFAMRTGAQRIASDGAAIFVSEKLWDHDRIVRYKSTQSSPSKEAPAHNKTESAIAESSPDRVVDVPESQRVWPNIWPHFWIPSTAVGPDGALIQGETFFEDLGQDWAGNARLGFDSYLGRPFGSLSLERRHFGNHPLLSIGVSAFSDPIQIGGLVSDQRGVAIASTSRFFVGEHHLLSISAGFGYLKVLDGILYPSLAVKIIHARGPLPGINHWAVMDRGWALQGLARFFRELEVISSGTVQAPLPGPGGIRLHLDYGQGSDKNLPESFFEWGGYPILVSADRQFMNRGFPVHTAYAKELVRGEASMGYRLWSGFFGASWNRGRVSELQQSLIAETISFSGYGNSRYHMGHNLFTSVGGETDLLGWALFYTEWKLGLGIFHGFGQFGENRVTISLQSRLDL